MKNSSSHTSHASARILGINLSLISKKKLFQLIRSSIRESNRLIVASGNIQSFNLAYKDIRLQKFMNNADVVRLDGAGLGLGARILGYVPPARMTWADLAWDLAGLCRDDDYSMYLLGNGPGMAQKAAEILESINPGLRIVGCMHGFFQKSSGHPENRQVIENINQANPDILIVGLGMPLQEYWLEENMDKLKVPIIMCAGAAFEWIAGEKKRAPQWMLNYGLEWFWRLWLEPRRLFKRYVIGNPVFIIRVMRQKIYQRIKLYNNSND